MDIYVYRKETIDSFSFIVLIKMPVFKRASKKRRRCIIVLLSLDS